MDKRLHDAETRKWIYLQAALAALYLLTNMLVPTTIAFMKPLHFGIRKYLMAAMILLYFYLCRFEYSKEIWIAAVYWIWLVASRFLINGVSSFKADISMVTDNIFFILLLGIGQVLNREQRLHFMDIISAAIAMFTTICSTIGLMCAITRQPAYNSSGKILCTLTDIKRIDSYGVNPNVCGLWFVLGVIFLAYLFFRCKKLRWLIVPAAVLNYFATALTYSRNSQLAFASCAALAAVLGLRPKLSKLTCKRRTAALCAVIVLVIPAAFMSFSLAQMAAGKVSSAEYIISGGTAGYAKEADPASVPQEAQNITVSPTEAPDETLMEYSVGGTDFLDHRGLSDSGRTKIWLTAIETIREEPIRLLRGCEKKHCMDYSNLILPKKYGHYHSSPIQLLMETGIPGLLIAAALILTICVKALKLFLSDTAEIAEKMLVLIIVATVQYSLLESLIYYYTSLASLTFFLVAGTITKAWDELSSSGS